MNLRTHILSISKASNDDAKKGLFRVVFAEIDETTNKRVDETQWALLSAKKKDATNVSEGMKKFLGKLIDAANAEEGDDASREMTLNVNVVAENGKEPIMFIQAEDYRITSDQKDELLASL